jgi:PAS domain S-box-containing protein
MVRDRGLARQRGETLPDRYPFKLVRKDGTERWVDFTAGRIEFQGEPAGLGTAFDITERTYAEEALARQALAFANLYDAIVITDLRGRITDWNPAAERIYGWTRAEVLGETVDLWLAPSDAADLNHCILHALDTEGRWTGMIRFLRKDGRLGLSETVVLPLRDPSGRRLGALGVSRDITESEHAAEALRISEERYHLMVAGSEQVFFYQHDVDGVYETLSPSVEGVLGYAPEELVGKRYGSLHPSEGWDAAEVDEQTAVHDRRSTQLVHAIIALAHNLGVRVVAEGVETAAQLASLRGQRCDYAQGFLFARPLTASDADLLLDRETRW